MTETGAGESSNDPKVVFVAKLVLKLRNPSYSRFNLEPRKLDICLAYFFELCQQLNYSITSPVKLESQMTVVIDYWFAKTSSLYANR